MKRVICSLIAFQMAFLPAASAARADAPAVTRPEPTEAQRIADNAATIRVLRKEIETNPSNFYAETDLNNAAADLNKALAQEGLKELVKKLKDTSVPMSSIREGISWGAASTRPARPSPSASSRGIQKRRSIPAFSAIVSSARSRLVRRSGSAPPTRRPAIASFMRKAISFLGSSSTAAATCSAFSS